eukprot:4922756-Lingulodinium_polyedra.AAC.1
MGDIMQVRAPLGRKGGLRRVIRKLPPWKAGVGWSIPNEIRRVMVGPSWVYRKQEKLGLGAQPVRVEAPA